MAHAKTLAARIFAPHPCGWHWPTQAGTCCRARYASTFYALVIVIALSPNLARALDSECSVLSCLVHARYFPTQRFPLTYVLEMQAQCVTQT